ncbi:MAG TPA: NrfD/PsrC family molybdoenzyme membrane anchor subunit [Chloroflexota bacterium]|nr:NrfD/PsrC family molybdoenzyme membrane anchor subunit [Chloroflexota bacterium]
MVASDRAEQPEPFLEHGFPPLLGRDNSYGSITDRVDSLVLTQKTRWWWWTGLLTGLLLVGLLLLTMGILLFVGVGVWGIMIPVAWGYAITSFVWWIGIGHAGTLISAILFLLKQHWRTSINRFAEAMTIFAVVQAGLYPIFHLGRPWFFYWLIPYPATMGVWPQFRSPLIWDFFAVSTYFTVSLIFWYLGMIPDLASIRDRATSRLKQVIYGMLAVGWRGSARHWQRYEQTYYLFAALATPLVVSVHSVVSSDFAIAIVPGWHETIFPPYFVAGALFSGFAMVLTIAIPLRVAYQLQDFVTDRHLDIMARFTLATGLAVDYSYLVEHFMGWYSGNQFEQFLLSDRAFGPYGIFYWLVLACNVGVTQLLWFKRIRTAPLLLFVVSILINVGMWTERFMIVVGSLAHDYLPAAWGIFTPTVWDWAFLLGTMGLFASLMFLFVRLLPVIPAFEMRRLFRELWLGRRG